MRTPTSTCVCCRYGRGPGAPTLFGGVSTTTSSQPSRRCSGSTRRARSSTPLEVSLTVTSIIIIISVVAFWDVANPARAVTASRGITGHSAAPTPPLVTPCSFPYTSAYPGGALWTAERAARSRFTPGLRGAPDGLQCRLSAVCSPHQGLARDPAAWAWARRHRTVDARFPVHKV
jgi:hypothetical protein